MALRPLAALEVETFLRFSDIEDAVKKKNVLQAFGITMGSLTWADVVVKLLNHDAHLPLQRHLSYVGQRVRWFFMHQKEPMLQFMKGLKGGPEEKLYSMMYSKHAQLIEDNPTIKKMVFETFDLVIERQLKHFLELFRNMLQATFSNPWVFMKKMTARLARSGFKAMPCQSHIRQRAAFADSLARCRSPNGLPFPSSVALSIPGARFWTLYMMELAPLKALLRKVASQQWRRSSACKPTHYMCITHSQRLPTNADIEMDIPTLEDTKRRIPEEIISRSGTERMVASWLSAIPTEPHKIDEAVECVEVLVVKVYSRIRSQVCDQVELFCESFFKLPLLRRLEEDMHKIQLSPIDLEGYRVRRARLEKEAVSNTHGLKEVRECLKILANFQVKSMARKP